MSTLLGLEKTADYETLKEWCLTACDYLLKIDPQHSFLVAHPTNPVDERVPC